MSVNLNFSVPKDEPLFGVGFLDDLNLFTRVFFQSGKRYTPQRLIGYDPQTGRPQYVSETDRPLEAVGENWFYIDMNLEKVVDVAVGKLIATLEVENILDNTNSQILNPVTGRAYEYGDPTTLGTNDPLYPQLAGDISPYPYNPARYLKPRSVRFSLGFRF
jgi:hypothetical protein